MRKVIAPLTAALILFMARPVFAESPVDVHFETSIKTDHVGAFIQADLVTNRFATAVRSTIGVIALVTIRSSGYVEHVVWDPDTEALRVSLPETDFARVQIRLYAASSTLLEPIGSRTLWLKKGSTGWEEGTPADFSKRRSLMVQNQSPAPDEGEGPMPKLVDGLKGTTPFVGRFIR